MFVQNALKKARFNATDFFFYVALTVPFWLIVGRGLADALMGVVSLAFIVRSIALRDARWIKTPWFILAVITSLYLVLSGALSQFDATDAAFAGLAWLRFPLFVMGCVTWLWPHRKFEKSLTIFLPILLLLVAIDTLWQFTFGTSLTGHPDSTYPGRLSGPFTRYVVGIYLAHFIYVAAGAALCAAMISQQKIRNLVLCAGFVLAVGAAILVSGERMAFALFLFCGFIFALSAKKLRNVMLASGIAVFATVVVCLVLIPSVYDRWVVNTVPYIKNFSTSPYGAALNNGILAWQQSPIFGIGLNNFPAICNEMGAKLGFLNGKTAADPFVCLVHPHNIYLEWLAEAGLIGLGLFIGLVILWGREAVANLRAMPRHDPHYYVVLGSVVAVISFLWPINISMSFFSNWTAIIFWWVLSMMLRDDFLVTHANAR